MAARNTGGRASITPPAVGIGEGLRSIKILDLQERNADFIESVPDDIIFEVVDIVSGFLEVEE